MSIDKDKLKALAEDASKVPDWYSPQSFGLSRVTGGAERDFIGAAGPATILALLAEIERLKAGVDSDWAEIERIQLLYSEQFRKARALRIERDRLKTDNEAWRLTVEAERRIKRGISDENEALRMQVKELDLTFGRYLLGMRAAVVEWQKGKGADAAMQWIWNGLRGPGELPPEEETQAQAYFDREVVKIEEGLEEVYAYRDKRRAENAKERGQ